MKALDEEAVIKVFSHSMPALSEAEWVGMFDVAFIDLR